MLIDGLDKKASLTLLQEPLCEGGLNNNLQTMLCIAYSLPQIITVSLTKLFMLTN